MTAEPQSNESSGANTLSITGPGPTHLPHFVIYGVDADAFSGPALRTLRTLHVHNTALAMLPDIKDLETLTTLTCSHNIAWTTLPELPPHLEHLAIAENQYLTTLPTFPTSIRSIICSQNPRLGLDHVVSLSHCTALQTFQWTHNSCRHCRIGSCTWTACL